MTQIGLAQKLNVHYQAIQKWEKGKGAPTTKQISLLADALGVSVETLLAEFSGKIPGNTSLLTNKLYELVYELPLISNVNQPIRTTDPETAVKAIVKGTYKVLMPFIELDDQKHVIIKIEGDSMDPEIKHGAFVLAEVVPPTQFKSVQPGVFAVLYTDGFIINRLRSNDLSQTHQLQLFSDNEKFGSVTIPEGDLLKIWKVLVKVQERVS